MKILITGGAGFIGSAVVRQYIAKTDATVVNVDALTYAGDLGSLENAARHPRHIFEHVDIRDRRQVRRLFKEYQPNAVMHLAAESHVDRSIEAPSAFVETNITGTFNLLEAARGYWDEIDGVLKKSFRFHHVSTDEVYGDLDPDDPAFTEEAAYVPSSPYAATKAASDHLVRTWHRTYGLPVIITNCSNNFGPYQFPEKLIPLMIINALAGETLPIYGQGNNIRDWLYVDDHARALRHTLTHGQVGRTYNIGGRNEQTNLSVVQALCTILNRIAPDPKGGYERLIEFVKDRPGHDRRYAIDDRRIAKELGWNPEETFESGLQKTIEWYLDHREWAGKMKSATGRARQCEQLKQQGLPDGERNK